MENSPIIIACSKITGCFSIWTIRCGFALVPCHLFWDQICPMLVREITLLLVPGSAYLSEQVSGKSSLSDHLVLDLRCLTLLLLLRAFLGEPLHV